MCSRVVAPATSRPASPSRSSPVRCDLSTPPACHPSRPYLPPPTSRPLPPAPTSRPYLPPLPPARPNRTTRPPDPTTRPNAEPSGAIHLSLTTDKLLRVDATLPTHSERLLCLVSVIVTNEVLFFYGHWAMHMRGSQSARAPATPRHAPSTPPRSVRPAALGPPRHARSSPVRSVRLATLGPPRHARSTPPRSFRPALGPPRNFVDLGARPDPSCDWI